MIVLSGLYEIIVLPEFTAVPLTFLDIIFRIDTADYERTSIK